MGDAIGTGEGADPVDTGRVPTAPPADVLQLLGDLFLPTDDADVVAFSVDPPGDTPGSTGRRPTS